MNDIFRNLGDSKWVALVAIVSLALASAAFSASPAMRPNVVLVLTDDQGWGDLSCHGNPVLNTPNLDSLHATSLRLTNFHVDPVCAPTRAALMSGRYPVRGGITSTTAGESLLRNDGPAMADFFAAGGYGTAMFGKWHLGDNFPCRPEDRGFQEVVRIGGGGIAQTPDAWGNNYFDDRYWHSDGRHNDGLKQYQGYGTDVLFDEAIDYMRNRSGEPFFVYLSTGAPHAPYNVADRYSRPFRDRGLPEMVANFYGMIANIDDNMGRLMRFLEDEGLSENTVLIFTTDNGTSGGTGPRAKQVGWDGWDGGRRGSKGSLHEGGHAMPCFVRWPAGGWVGGRDIDGLTAHLDLLPTFIDVLGLPDLEHAGFDGKSLRPLLEGSDAVWPDRTLFISMGSKGDRGLVMTDEWRLIRQSEQQPWELFAIRKDPYQEKNIAAQHPAKVEDLARQWDAWFAEASKGARQRVAIVVGDDRENPSVLTAHDWAKEEPSSYAAGAKYGSLPWNQFEVLKMPYLNGTWTIEVAKDATYEVTLRAAPPEAKLRLTAVKARVQIGDLALTKDVEPEWVGEFGNSPSGFRNEVGSAVFQMRLPKGRTQMRTFLIDADGRERGAFYATVRRLDP